METIQEHKIWALDQEVVDRMIDRTDKRWDAVIKANGGRIFM